MKSMIYHTINIVYFKVKYRIKFFVKNNKYEKYEK